MSGLESQRLPGPVGGPRARESIRNHNRQFFIHSFALHLLNHNHIVEFGSTLLCYIRTHTQKHIHVALSVYLLVVL